MDSPSPRTDPSWGSPASESARGQGAQARATASGREADLEAAQAQEAEAAQAGARSEHHLLPEHVSGVSEAGGGVYGALTDSASMVVHEPREPSEPSMHTPSHKGGTGDRLVLFTGRQLIYFLILWPILFTLITFILFYLIHPNRYFIYVCVSVCVCVYQPD
jgi:hypothetical protein